MKYEAFTLCGPSHEGCGFHKSATFPAKNAYRGFQGLDAGSKEKSTSLPFGPYAHDALTSKRRALRTLRGLRQLGPGKAWGR